VAVEAAEYGVSPIRPSNVDTSQVTQQITGYKVGVERIVTTGKNIGTPEFYGAAATKEGAYIGTGQSLKVVAGKMPYASAYISQPTGVTETMLYASPALKEQYRVAGKLYFQQKGLQPETFQESLDRTAGKESDIVSKAISQSGGTVGGSTVERSIIAPSGKSLAYTEGTRYYGNPVAKDIDVVYYQNVPTGPQKLAKGVGGEAIQKPLPISYAGYPADAFKYEITSKGGVKFDVTVISPTIAGPKPVGMFGEFGMSYTTSSLEAGGRGLTTYSPQQQIASKTMTLASSGFGVVPLEAGKEKYLQDIAGFAKAVGERPPAIDVQGPLLTRPIQAASLLSLSPITGARAAIGEEQPSTAEPRIVSRVGETEKPPSLTRLSGSGSSMLSSSFLSLSPSDLSPSPSSPSPSVSTPSPSLPSISPGSSSSSFSSSESSSTSSSISSSFSSVVNRPAVLPSTPVPFPTPFGGGGGAGARGGRTKVSGEVRSLLEVEFGQNEPVRRRSAPSTDRGIIQRTGDTLRAIKPTKGTRRVGSSKLEIPRFIV
jgi:hypothetical protein